MKSCGRPPLTRAWTTILSATSLKGSVWSVAQILIVDIDRCDVAERVEELDLRAGPRGLVAAILVGQQVDVVAIRVGGLREAMEALVDVTGERVDLTVARERPRRPSVLRRARLRVCWSRPAIAQDRNARAPTRGFGRQPRGTRARLHRTGRPTTGRRREVRRPRDPRPRP